MTLDQFNKLENEEQKKALLKCCGSSRWVDGLVNLGPFNSMQDLHNKADEVWAECDRADTLQAFSQHPKIGDRKILEEKFQSTKEWAGNEQGGMDAASSDVITRMMKGNEVYLEKFGYIFIVYASGKSATEMLEILESRINNDPETELKIARQEQHKITKLRLNKLISMSQITTHVLDTARGIPAAGINISLQRPGSEPGSWETICSGTTNADGRIANFLSEDTEITAGIYRMLFDTAKYFRTSDVDGFYPFVPVVFEIKDTGHYHIPLLLSPFGYSTYRGS